MKKLMALLLSAAMVFALAACSNTPNSAKETDTGSVNEAAADNGAEAANNGDKITIYAMTPTEDHGWTGSVASFAKQAVAVINTEGKYNAELLTADSAAEQIQQIEDLLANHDASKIAVSILPYDDTAESGVQQLVAAGVPIIMFDRIITSCVDDAVANVTGDNEGIGAASASYCVEQGMQPGDRVVVLEGDASSVNIARNDGFTGYLLGEVSYNGNTIAEPWTQEQIDSSVVWSGVLSWSQSNAQEYVETLLSDSGNSTIKYWAAWDDGYVMGLMDALSGSAIDESIKTTFLNNKPVICGCSGLAYVYDLLAGTSTYPEYVEIYEQLGSMMYTTYSPGMMGQAVELMAEYLDGATFEQDYVIVTEIVTADNYANYESFN